MPPAGLEQRPGRPGGEGCGVVRPPYRAEMPRLRDSKLPQPGARAGVGRAPLAPASFNTHAHGSRAGCLAPCLPLAWYLHPRCRLSRGDPLTEPSAGTGASPSSLLLGVCVGLTLIAPLEGQGRGKERPRRPRDWPRSGASLPFFRSLHKCHLLTEALPGHLDSH